MPIEDFDQLGEVSQRAGQAIDFVKVLIRPFWFELTMRNSNEHDG